jgi:hypothetical protein
MHKPCRCELAFVLICCHSSRLRRPKPTGQAGPAAPPSPRKRPSSWYDHRRIRKGQDHSIQVGPETKAETMMPVA